MDHTQGSGRDLFETSGYSMWPSVKAQDRLLVFPAEVDELKPGDLIIYRQGPTSVCHRFVRRAHADGEDVLLTRQDYGSRGDTEAVPRSCYRGKVCAIIRGTKIIATDSPTFVAQSRLLLACAPLFSVCVNALQRLRTG